MNLKMFPSDSGPVFVNPGYVVSAHPVRGSSATMISTTLHQNHIVNMTTEETYARLKEASVAETLADMAQNLYSMALPFMRETDPVWRAMQKEYVAAMKLAGREPPESNP